MEEMASQDKMNSAPGSSDDAKKMYEILKRIENEQPFDSDFGFGQLSDEELDSDDDENPPEDDDDLSKRLEGIDLNDADAIWSKLTESERLGFNKIVESEDVTSILPKFNAWWETKIKRKLVTEMDGGKSDESEPQAEHPKIIETIWDFSRISTKPPAVCVVHNLKNVLASYSLMVRYLYGEHMTSKNESVSYLMTVCANLRANANFDDSAVAIESVRQDALNEGHSVDEQDMRQIRKDVDHLTDGPIQDKRTNTYVLAALSDLHRLLSIVKAEKKYAESKPATLNIDNVQIEASDEPTKEFSTFSKRYGDRKVSNYHHLEKGKLTAMIKKIEFFLAFVKTFQ